MGKVKPTGRGRYNPGTGAPAQGFGNGKTGLKAVLVEAVPQISPRKPDPLLPLMMPQGLLRSTGLPCKERMIIEEASQDRAVFGFLHRVEGDEVVILGLDAL